LRHFDQRRNVPVEFGPSDRADPTRFFLRDEIV
jgi:hypothetical protein